MQTHCLYCHKEIPKPDKVKKYCSSICRVENIPNTTKQYRDRNKDVLGKKHKEYREKNKEYFRAKGKEWYENYKKRKGIEIKNRIEASIESVSEKIKRSQHEEGQE